MPIAKANNFFVLMKPLHRILFSTILTTICFFIFRKVHFNNILLGLALWDVFALGYIINSWIVFFYSSTTHISKRAKMEDGSRLFVFFVIVVASFASMVTVLLLIISKDTEGIPKLIYLPVSIGGILLSWILVHTTFTFHYAHLFYDNVAGTNKNKFGLIFPGEEDPDYLDFAYFSFVVGMTFQVSDVEINAKIIRRTALAHGLLSFALNTFVVALTINLIAGLKG